MEAWLSGVGSGTLGRSNLTFRPAFRTGPLIAGNRFLLWRMRPVVIGRSRASRRCSPDPAIN